MLIPNRTTGDILANLGALVLGIASYPLVLVLLLCAVALV